ncbi:MAG: HAD-IIA family hydrolase [Ignavibacterium sp.]|jgi:HAD superfamily hydrolase (TIGR01450 family)|nr:HAD-IIA family hydrolase [Ignavibacterium sp.]
MVNKYDSFIFDLDGTVYRGDDIIPGADITINRLKDSGKKLIFISNKTTGTIRDYYTFLKSFRLDIEESEIINSTYVLKNYLKDNYINSTFYAIGEEIFIKEISEARLNYSEDPSKVEILLVTLDRTLNYKKLETAANALENGARFFAANIDDTCPVSGGEVLDAGSTISALEKRTHRKLELNFGKPSKFMMDEVMKRLSSDKSKTLLIGDRLETDIAMGNRFGIDTALVSTGVKHYTNGNSDIKPTYYLNSVADLIKK